MDLLTIYTHSSKLQVITAPTLNKSASAMPFPACHHQPFPGNAFYQWRFFSFTHSGYIFTTSITELPLN
jgi:hypothetical protein